MTKEAQDNRIHYLYRIINKINGKIYIGQTVEPDKRWYQHRRDAANPTMVIHHAINKYGADNFEFEVIAGCKTWDDANDTETLLVSQYNSLVSEQGYNVSLGGYNAPKSEEWKQAMRDWHASLSPEERQEISKKQSEATINQIATQGHPAQGRIVTEEERELYRKIRLDNPIEYTEEIRKNMSESHIGKVIPEEQRKKMAAGVQANWDKRNAERFATGEIKCNAPGCEIFGKAKYKIIDGVRYCNKHGLRLLTTGFLELQPRSSHNKGVPMTEEAKEKVRLTKLANKISL
jgi:group I intron endonuclease